MAPFEAATIENDVEAAEKMLQKAGLVDPQYKCGKTKIFFQAGVLSKLEEVREEALSRIILKMQCHCRKVLVQVSYNGKEVALGFTFDLGPLTFDLGPLTFDLGPLTFDLGETIDH